MFNWIPFLSKKCFICGKRDEKVLKFKSREWDNNNHDYCHKECLENLVKTPSENSNINALAVSILDKLSYEKQYLQRTQNMLKNYDPDHKPSKGEEENVEAS
jgi:hypothetical protein